MSFMSTDTYDEWDEDDPPRSPTAAPARTKAQEQMSPVTVVLYVVFLYTVWQILTRSDDNEILSHLPSSSPLLVPHGLEQRPSSASGQQQQQPSSPYFPYVVPQLQQPPTSLASLAEQPSSSWRSVLYTIVYPLYLAITLIAIPLPLLMNGLQLLASILSTVLYPVTWTARLLSRTFIVAPLSVILSFLHVLYPVYVFVGAVVGIGAFVGVTIGWAGRFIMWVLLDRRSSPPVASKRSKKRRSGSKRHSVPAPSYAHEERVRERERNSRGHPPVHGMHAQTIHAEPQRAAAYEYERRYVPIVDYVQLGDGLNERLGLDARGTAREVVLGLRRRGVRV